MNDIGPILPLRVQAVAFAALIALILVGGSCTTTRVVTAVTPYVAVLPQDTANHALGSTDCDLNGRPIIFVNLRVRSTYLQWVILHERVHVEQILAFPGGCPRYANAYGTNDKFRLRAEAEAFCDVLAAQTAAGIDPMPDRDDIVALLTSTSGRGYKGQWTSDDVRSAMPCWTNPRSHGHIEKGASK